MTQESRNSNYTRNIIDTIGGTILVISVALGGWTLTTVDSLKDRVIALESNTSVSSQLTYVSKSMESMEKSVKAINEDVMQIKITLAKQGQSGG